MRTTCEVVVQDILPILRAEIAKELINSYNLNQGDAAKLLDVSQPAISQYLRQLRGKGKMFNDDEVKKQVTDLASRLHTNQINQNDLSGNLCKISKNIIEKGLVKGTVDCNNC